MALDEKRDGKETDGEAAPRSGPPLTWRGPTRRVAGLPAPMARFFLSCVLRLGRVDDTKRPVDSNSNQGTGREGSSSIVAVAKATDPLAARSGESDEMRDETGPILPVPPSPRACALESLQMGGPFRLCKPTTRRFRPVEPARHKSFRPIFFFLVFLSRFFFKGLPRRHFLIAFDARRFDLSFFFFFFSLSI